MLLSCTDFRLTKEIKILRIAAAQINEYYATPRKDRPASCSQFLVSHFENIGVAIQSVKTIASDTGYNRVLSQLKDIDNGAD